MAKVFGLFVVCLGALQPIFAQGYEDPELEVVDYVDLDRYLGTWYEIASIPQSFQEGCSDSQAVYSKLRRNRIRVVNSCEVDGRTRTARGRAWVVDPESNAKT